MHQVDLNTNTIVHHSKTVSCYNFNKKLTEARRLQCGDNTSLFAVSERHAKQTGTQMFLSGASVAEFYKNVRMLCNNSGPSMLNSR